MVVVTVVITDTQSLIDAAVQRLRDDLRSLDLDVNLLRNLGAGGNGPATLFDISHGTTGLRTKFVVKTSLRDNIDMARKKYFMLVCGILSVEPGSIKSDPWIDVHYSGLLYHFQRLKRARHIVQILEVNVDLMAGTGFDQDSLRWQGLYQDPSMIVLEYMKNGDLFGLVDKVVSAGVDIPNTNCWKIVFCRKNQNLDARLHGLQVLADYFSDFEIQS